MGKHRKSKSSNSEAVAAASSSTNSKNKQAELILPPAAPATISLREWISREPRGLWWVLGSILAGAALGFLLGTGWLEVWGSSSTSSSSSMPTPWRQDLADRLRSTMTYRWVTGHEGSWDWRDWMALPFNGWRMTQWQNRDVYPLLTNPSHPRVFTLLRESIVREVGGYVHPDLGFLVPAPSGAARGIGMVRNSYHRCQVHCLPGLASEKLQVQRDRQIAEEKGQDYPRPSGQIYKQEEVLIKVPLAIQMTRQLALSTLLPLLPSHLHPNLHQLDDAALLVLLLAHERGVGKFSNWMPYIASLPPEPSCGYSHRLRPYLLDAIQALHHQHGVDTQGWPEELLRATQYADTIVKSLTKDFGMYLQTPKALQNKGTAAAQQGMNIAWALCQVASRATAGSPQYGSLRLVPLLDQINHDVHAGGFIELTGHERLEKGDLVNAVEEDDAGAFVVRSLRHGRRRPLKKGQELLANYNVPHYAPLDWLVSLGFVPPEKQVPWEKIDPVLPRVRQDGPFAPQQNSAVPTAAMWEKLHRTKFLEQLEKKREL